MDGGPYGRRYGNSLVHAVLGALISTACGYTFGRYRFAHREKLSGLAPAAVMVLQTVLTLPLCPMASGAGPVNTFRAVLIPLLFSPFGVCLGRILSQGHVPDEVFEAARMEGAGELAACFRAVLRMLGPELVTLLLFQLTAIWNNSLLPMVMLSEEDLSPVGPGLHSWNSVASVSPGHHPVVIMGSLLAVVPPPLTLLQRFWRSGPAAGPVK